jgi:hypothetical protein
MKLITKVKKKMKVPLCFYILSHASALPSGERSLNPVCLNFPLAYEYRKHVENRI